MKNYLVFFYLFFLSLIFTNCKINHAQQAKNKGETLSSSNNKENNLRNWHLKDFYQDSVPGLSLTRAYEEIIKKRKGKKVIVAVIDTDVDINHENLKKNIWVNNKEKLNGKDDDQNGYIDDINGWNYIADSNGNTELFVNYEYTRILKKYDSYFSGKEKTQIREDQKKEYQEYIRAKKAYEKRMQFALKEKQYIDYYLQSSEAADKALAQLFPNKNYTKNKVDSLLTLKTTDPLLISHLKYILTELKYGITDEWIDNYKLKTYERLEKLLNKDFNDRSNIGDNPNDLNDVSYGSRIVNKNARYLEHGTLVSGVIAADRDYKGSEGILENVKLMVLCVSSLGDENDKDIALAIRYAVENGAQVINISSGKEFSIHNDWVINEFKNAEKKDVIIVTSAGNSNKNLDQQDVFSYPNDTNEEGLEIVGNFIKVSSSSFSVGKNFKKNETAYGKRNVDVFAPGEKIYTTSSKESKSDKFSSGTSMASALTSGVAALLFSHYPKLSAKQVKQILMDSGASYNVDIEIKEADGTKKLVPFSELSKSGKVVNAYNALLLAEKISNSK